ncbi:hypothetical protein BATDEDRAFT_37370 [Batrachochytrium dendrobatidis JAM81]|uniref:NAD-dependent epimerase/dehydratase domain-containing protein n=1 Tax=Batrachochytrium dendrobatidis (strain JAM81 / FGSC 10211) TaxID=684364 RepID=F4PAK7_BATDJ|nr:uncharacterized protein BATDEDRAFT_37370 [Batrachochytrium dendrobatidis JAM81]EGF77702.1 hypothetical protein BATDEDRAFT_37370 [Batrachochytrium dendrobatidis JAM81]KAJ8323539.1 Protein-lysine N-methyltransferase efm5 [Batrachochytrium dendrobatidis]KAK5666138.1 Protein-lysine N-methyltransferase efm5 [Batrachochytrium dendrobatidis]|eukprot:XP_006681739.1 hypothetical protein BATDEDRAFT_37370 [Batrachochytrium dendrobatidis JAM81]
MLQASLLPRTARSSIHACKTQMRAMHDIVKREKTGKTYTSLGPGGRSSSSGQTATVFGATGFLGRYVVNNLGKIGTTVVTPYRGSDDERRHLRNMGDLGQIVQLRFDLRREEQIAECLKHSDVVYNLVGRDYETKNFNFEQVHVEGARRLARIARENGVARFIHMSALNASENSPSQFLRTKALGEKAVLEEYPDATIVRSATMYGDEDRFWNRMGWFAKWAPGSILPVVHNGKARIRPVYVGDVAIVLSKMLQNDASVGKMVELYGPREYHYRTLVGLFQKIVLRERTILNIPKPIAKLAAKIWDQLLVYPVISPDDIERQCISDVVSSDHSDIMKFKDFDILPHTIEETIGRFVLHYRPGELYSAPFEPIKNQYSTSHIKM